MKWTPIFFFAGGAWVFQAFQAPDPVRPAARPARTAIRAVPPDIQRGDKVAVRVVSGNVLLTFQAEAVSAAHVGETVIVLNPENGRRFVARVEDKGKVIVKK